MVHRHSYWLLLAFPLPALAFSTGCSVEGPPASSYARAERGGSGGSGGAAPKTAQGGTLSPPGLGPMTDGGIPSFAASSSFTPGGSASIAGSSSGGAVASSGSGGRSVVPSGQPVECQPGAKRCDASAPVAQVCSAEGLWLNEPCQFVCSNGACSGACTPGERSCAELQPQRCNDRGEWIADGPACSAQCSEGACTGDCRNGDTQCASGTSVQQCVEGAWSAAKSCAYVCVNGACGGVCQPMKTRCSGAHMETCSSGGDWSNATACEFVCSGDQCSGSCVPGEKRCTGNTLELCNARGDWEFSQTCSNACVDKACGGVCRPGATRCASLPSTLETCDALGQWVQSPCPGACANDSCVDCAQGKTDCTSSTQIRSCGSNNQWGSPVDCPNACIDDACGGVCRPGARECTGSGLNRYRTCNDQGAWTQTSCADDEACQAGKCGKFPKIVFVSSQVYTGNLGGLAGADQKCQALANAAGLNGTFRALLADASKAPSTSFNVEGGPYYLPHGKTLVAPHFWDLKNERVHAIDQDESGDPPPVAVIPSSAKLSSSCQEIAAHLVWNNTLLFSRRGEGCDGWTTDNAAAELVYFGDWSNPDDLESGCSNSGTTNPDAKLCSIKAPIVCVQQ